MHEQTAAVRLQLEGPIFALVEDWRRSQPKIPSRNEAIRLLLRRALERSSEQEPQPLAATLIHTKEMPGAFGGARPGRKSLNDVTSTPFRTRAQ